MDHHFKMKHKLSPQNKMSGMEPKTNRINIGNDILVESNKIFGLLAESENNQPGHGQKVKQNNPPPIYSWGQ